MHEFELKKREILDRVSLVDLVAEHVTLKRSGRRLVGLCPFHQEKTPSFTVSPDLGVFKCFGCGKGGDAFTFVQHRENVPFSEALRILADRAGVELKAAKPSVAGAPSAPGRADLARANAWAERFFRARLLDPHIGASALVYARSRGFTDATLETFGVGLASDGGMSLLAAAGKAGFGASVLVAADLMRTGDDGRMYETFRQRLMFPIRDATQRVIGFGGRTLVDDKAKYLNTRQTDLFDKSRCLFGVDLARESIAARGRAIVVEGYTDCMACHQAGFAEAVATLGTALTEQHVDLIRRYCDQAIFLFDSDEAGQAAADRAITVALPRCLRVRLARIPEGKDPGDYLKSATPGAFSDVLNHAVDALEFRWLQTSRRFQAELSDARRRDAVLEFLGLVAAGFDARAVDAIQRGLLVNQVAHLLRMDRREVDGQLQRLRARKAPASLRGAASDALPSTASGNAAAAVANGRAWLRLLEVLLNRPELITECEGVPSVAGVSEGRLRRVASLVLDLARQRAASLLTEVLARCEDPADSAMIADIARCGAERGNFEATLRAAVERLGAQSRAVAVERGRVTLLLGCDGESKSEDALDGVTELSEGLKEHSHFAPRTWIREALKTETPTAGTS